MDNNNLINEINKLKALIATLQQQLQTQQTENLKEAGDLDTFLDNWKDMLNS